MVFLSDSGGVERTESGKHDGEGNQRESAGSHSIPVSHHDFNLDYTKLHPSKSFLSHWILKILIADWEDLHVCWRCSLRRAPSHVQTLPDLRIL